MQGDFYIGSRSRRPRPTPRHRFSRTLLFLLCLLLVLALWVHFSLLPQARALCNTEISNRFESIANRKAYAILQQNKHSYDDFIHLVTTSDGGIHAATVDTVALNLLKTQLATAVLSELRTQNIHVRIPVGNLAGFLIFSGRGHDVTVAANVTESASARLSTSFTSVGINQTRHAIGISLSFSAKYLLGRRTESLTFRVDIPIGEPLIVGEVPDTLTQINRLTDDITEIEIDDAVDFGNVLP